MLSSLDPYTVYYNEQEVLQFKISNTGEYTGIGALITREILREEKPPFSQNTSMTLKASAMTIHPIINGRDQSTSDALLAKRLNINVMFNIHPPFLR